MPEVNEDLVEPHVESMNYFLSEGMQAVVMDMKPQEVRKQAGLLHVSHDRACCYLSHSQIIACPQKLYAKCPHLILC